MTYNHRSLVTNNTVVDSPAAARKGDETEELALMSVQDNNESKL